MTLAHPLALLWFLLAIPIVWLWLRRAAPPREPVATGTIWQQALAAERFRAGWQRWRRPTSLAIRLLVLLLLVAALADPRTRPPQRMVLVLDNSAGMNAADVAPSRLAAAKEAARQIVDSLRDDDSAAVVTAGGPAAVRCGLTADRAVLRAALENIPAASGPTEMAAAVDLARRLLPEHSGNRIVILSDGCFPGAADLAHSDGIALLPVGTRAGNIAITRLAARSGATGVPPVLDEAPGQNPRLCQVLVEVRSFCDRAVKCRLRIQSKEEFIGLQPNGRWQAVWELPAPAGGRITARLDSADVPAAGNAVSAAVEGKDPGNVVGLLQSVSPPLQEFDLRVPNALGSDVAAVVARPAGPPIGLFLLLAGGLLIGAEWCLVQRRWMC